MSTAPKAWKMGSPGGGGLIFRKSLCGSRWVGLGGGGGRRFTKIDQSGPVPPPILPQPPPSPSLSPLSLLCALRTPRSLPLDPSLPPPPSPPPPDPPPTPPPLPLARAPHRLSQKTTTSSNLKLAPPPHPPPPTPHPPPPTPPHECQHVPQKRKTTPEAKAHQSSPVALVPLYTSSRWRKGEIGLLLPSPHEQEPINLWATRRTVASCATRTACRDRVVVRRPPCLGVAWDRHPMAARTA